MADIPYQRMVAHTIYDVPGHSPKTHALHPRAIYSLVLLRPRPDADMVGYKIPKKNIVTRPALIRFYSAHADSISCNSSGENGGLCKAIRFFCICVTELEPIITLVTLSSFRIQANDISANVCPRRAAICSKAAICDNRCSVSDSFFK